MMQNMNSNQDTYKCLISSIRKITPLTPKVYFRENSSNIMILWDRAIPNEETASKIEEALKEFGVPIESNLRDFGIVAFTIFR